MQRQPTLLNSCAKAASATEARYRIDSPLPTVEARVVALDAAAAASVRKVASEPWRGARFFLLEPSTSADHGGNGQGEPSFRDFEGRPLSLAEVLEGADVVVMVLTGNEGADAAGALSSECSRRSIMTAGLILGPLGEVDTAVAALRPHARVIISSRDATDISEVLTALRS